MPRPPQLPQDAKTRRPRGKGAAESIEALQGEIVPEVDNLTLKQRLFVEAYIGKARGNATEAARLAGYDGDDVTLASCGYANLQKAHIVSELTQRRKELVAAVSAESMILSAHEEATASLDDFLTINEDGTFAVNLLKAKQLGKLHLLESVDHDRETGAPIIRLQSRKSARDFVAKMLGLGKSDAPVVATQVNVYNQLQSLPPEEIKRLREAQKTEGEKP